MRARQPGRFTTFSDMLAASEDGAARARRSRRPLALRLLSWGKSRNPYANVLLKVGYLATLPLRLVLALIALPFALHNRPLGAAVGFLALFGFWEVWESFAKEPFVSVYKNEQEICSDTRWAEDGRVHPSACKVTALKYTLNFVWEHALLAVWKSGLRQAGVDFDLAMTKERDRSWAAAGAVANRITYGKASGPEPPKPIVSKAKLSRVVVVDKAEGLPFIEINDEASIHNLEEGQPLPIFPPRWVGLGAKNLKKDVELQAVLRGDGTPVRCKLGERRGVGETRAYCVFIQKAGLYGIVPWNDFESVTHDKIASADGRPAVRHKSLWAEIPVDEKLGAVHVVNRQLPFYELQNPADKEIMIQGNARATTDAELIPAEAQTALRYAPLDSLDEVRCILGDDGKPVVAKYVFAPPHQPGQPVSGTTDYNPYYFVRVYDGRLGIVNKINYDYDARLKPSASR